MTTSYAFEASGLSETRLRGGGGSSSRSERAWSAIGVQRHFARVQGRVDGAAGKLELRFKSIPRFEPGNLPWQRSSTQTGADGTTRPDPNVAPPGALTGAPFFRDQLRTAERGREGAAIADLVLALPLEGGKHFLLGTYEGP